MPDISSIYTNAYQDDLSVFTDLLKMTHLPVILLLCINVLHVPTSNRESNHKRAEKDLVLQFTNSHSDLIIAPQEVE